MWARMYTASLKIRAQNGAESAATKQFPRWRVARHKLAELCDCSRRSRVTLACSLRRQRRRRRDFASSLRPFARDSPLFYTAPRAADDEALASHGAATALRLVAVATHAVLVLLLFPPIFMLFTIIRRDSDFNFCKN